MIILENYSLLLVQYKTLAVEAHGHVYHMNPDY